ncbi:MAG: hypothetical protein LBV45_06360 [Xanthomonadaceae bacterium]|nr:hypothetical protein [Xanthomonadaceae bacterium]
MSAQLALKHLKCAQQIVDSLSGMHPGGAHASIDCCADVIKIFFLGSIDAFKLNLPLLYTIVRS